MSTKREQQVTGYEVTVVSRLLGNLLSLCFYYCNREVVTVVTSYYGKLISVCKSLILLLLTNLRELTPYRGYRGVVSNHHPTPISCEETGGVFFCSQHEDLFGLRYYEKGIFLLCLKIVLKRLTKFLSEESFTDTTNQSMFQSAYP